MFQFVLTLTLWASPYAEGIRHEMIADALESQACSVEMSHMEWVETGPPQAFGTPTKLQSTLPVWIENTFLRLAFHRIDRVTVRCDSEEQVADAVRQLKRVSSLRTLSVYSKRFEVDDLETVLASVRVKELYVRGMRLPRTDIPMLSHDGLNWLGVMHTQFSNSAIDSLPMSLEYLNATRTRINDEGLPKFVRLVNLRTLNLRRTPTSQAAVDALRRDMPWCEIIWEPLRNP